MSKEANNVSWLKLRETLESADEMTNFQAAIKKAKRAGKLKLAAAFGVGATLGGTATAYIAYRLFKAFFGLSLLRRL